MKITTINRAIAALQREVQEAEERLEHVTGELEALREAKGEWTEEAQERFTQLDDAEFLAKTEYFAARAALEEFQDGEWVRKC